MGLRLQSQQDERRHVGMAFIACQDLRWRADQEALPLCAWVSALGTSIERAFARRLMLRRRSVHVRTGHSVRRGRTALPLLGLTCVRQTVTLIDVCLRPC